MEMLYQLSYPSTKNTNTIGAGDGNRTHVTSLENSCSTIELRPRLPRKHHSRRDNSNGWREAQYSETAAAVSTAWTPRFLGSILT